MEYKVYRASQRAKGKMLRENFSGMLCKASLLQLSRVGQQAAAEPRKSASADRPTPGLLQSGSRKGGYGRKGSQGAELPS